MKTFKDYSPDSKVWIYQSSREFTKDEHTKLNERLAVFCREWTAHNKQLHAGFDIVFDRFIVLTVDESGSSASGCSIDKSVRFLKEAGEEFGIGFFDRLQMAYMQNGEIHTAPYGELKELYKTGEIDAETRFFDCNVLKLSEYRTNFVRPLGQHWLMSKIA